MTDDAGGKRPRQEEEERQDVFARRFLTARVPVWLSLGLVVVIVATAAVLVVVQAGSGVRLGPAVGASQSIEVQIPGSRGRRNGCRVRQIVEAGRGPRRVSSIRGSCGVWCSARERLPRFPRRPSR